MLSARLSTAPVFGDAHAKVTRINPWKREEEKDSPWVHCTSRTWLKWVLNQYLSWLEVWSSWGWAVTLTPCTGMSPPGCLGMLVLLEPGGWL